jgi:NADPH:quinone reductase-like Zn-dependent oxidoreductase
MKAFVYTAYGPPDVLRLQELDKPMPKPDQVRVKVHAASVNYPDWSFLRGRPFLARLMSGGLVEPKHSVLGADIAGQVEAVGVDVNQFQPGDEVFGDISACGFGGFAEYVSVPETALAPKPANLTYEEAAAVPMAGVVALQGLRDVGRVRSGQQVLIVGASGGNGSFAVQMAKAFGAEVTGVCSTRNVDLVRSLGADRVIDYVKEDFASSGPRYDLVLATAGYRSILDYSRALLPNGTYVAVGGSMGQIFQPMLLGPLISMGGRKRMLNLSAKPDQEDLVTVTALLESGQVVPLIDKVYPFSEIPAALRYYGTGRARGKVVITIGHSGRGES